MSRIGHTVRRARLGVRRAGLGAAMLVLCLGAMGTRGLAVARSGCLPAGARTLAVDRAARVFSWHGAAYGCLNATAKRRKLGYTSFCNLPPGRAAPVKLAGALVGYGLETCGVDTGSSVVVVLDLASGKRLADVPASTLVLGAESYASVQSLVLRGDGAVGWITRDASLVGGRPVVYEVHRYAGDKSALLDSGATIDPSSLRLTGSRMSWRHGRVTRSGPL